MDREKDTIHLVVLQHGLWGHSGDVAKLTEFLRNAFQEQSQGLDEIVILNSEVNSRRLTYDGIDVCGARLAHLVQESIQKYANEEKKVVKLSLIGYSLGGVIIRFAAGKLYVAGVLEKLQPCNLITIATPHLGSFREPKSYFARFFNSQVPIIASRTGRQLMLVDADYSVPWLTQQQEMHNKVHREHHHQPHRQQHQQYSAGGEEGISVRTAEASGAYTQQGVVLPAGVDPSKPVPLLLLMAHPAGPFWRALRRFDTRICAANIRYDTMVPYCTAALCVSNPYESSEPIPVNLEKYPSVVRPATTNEQRQQAAALPIRGRSRLFFLLVFLPLFPFFWAYTASFGILHHWRAKQRPLDSTWLQQYAAEHHMLSHAASKQLSKQLQHQQQQEQASAAAEVQELNAIEASVAFDQVAAEHAPTSITSRSFAPICTSPTAAGSTSAHQLSILDTAVAASPTSPESPSTPPPPPAVAAAEGLSVQSSIVEQALSSEGIVAHEGIAERPWALHEWQQWMAQKLFDEMPPCWVPERTLTVSSGSIDQDNDGAGKDEVQQASLHGSSMKSVDALVVAEAPTALLPAQQSSAIDSAAPQQHVLSSGSSSSSSSVVLSSDGRGGDGKTPGFTSSGGWHRVDVWRGHLHAHAAIIIRDNRFQTENRDFFQYIADHMTL